MRKKSFIKLWAIIHWNSRFISWTDSLLCLSPGNLCVVKAGHRHSTKVKQWLLVYMGDYFALVESNTTSSITTPWKKSKILLSSDLQLTFRGHVHQKFKTYLLFQNPGQKSYTYHLKNELWPWMISDLKKMMVNWAERGSFLVPAPREFPRGEGGSFTKYKGEASTKISIGGKLRPCRVKYCNFKNNTATEISNLTFEWPPVDFHQQVNTSFLFRNLGSKKLCLSSEKWNLTFIWRWCRRAEVV